MIRYTSSTKTASTQVVQIKSIITSIVLIAASITTSAQQIDKASLFGQKSSIVEIFTGVDFNYRDIFLDRPYQLLVNLTPGIKWHIRDHMQLNTGFLVPVLNQYGKEFARPRLDVLSLSHQMKFGNLALKPSVGLFTQERYGLDLKTFYTITEWMAFELQAGFTGYLSMAQGWYMSPMSKLLAVGGFDLYLQKWNTQFRIVGGRFLKDDNGVYAEGIRHFRHTSVGLYLQYSNFNSITGRQHKDNNGGFKVVIALPPYHRSNKKVQFRPADNFRLTYNMNADPHSCKTYFTDSEQNERHGWFAPDILPWGANKIHDFDQK